MRNKHEKIENKKTIVIIKMLHWKKPVIYS